MKKILLLAVCLLMLSCESSIISPFHPPSWITGEWEATSGLITFTFTRNNVLFTSKVSTPIDYKKQYSLSQITENKKNDVEYEFTIKIADTKYDVNMQQINRFVRVSSRKLIYYLQTNEKEGTPLEFTKIKY